MIREIMVPIKIAQFNGDNYQEIQDLTGMINMGLATYPGTADIPTKKFIHFFDRFIPNAKIGDYIVRDWQGRIIVLEPKELTEYLRRDTWQ